MIAALKSLLQYDKQIAIQFMNLTLIYSCAYT